MAKVKGRLRKLTVGRVLQYIFIYGITVIVMLPVLNIFVSAFKTNVEINRSTVFPAGFGFENFVSVLKNDIFYTGMFNSILITGVSLVIATFICAMAAYPLARLKNKVYSFIYYFFLSSMMIPAVANMVPLYTLMKDLGLIDTRIGMILLYSSNVSMGILLFTSFMKTIPYEIEEAAEIDGCGFFQRFWFVVFPLLKPVSVTYIMVSVLGIWNDFLMPQLFLSSRGKQTITLAVFTFKNERGSDWGAIFALMSLVVVVPMLLFLCNQKYFFEGMTIGAIKS